MSKFCNGCNFWDGVVFTRLDQKFGICSHPVASVNMIQDSEAKINEENTVYTAGSFGCVFCEPKKFQLIDINKTLKNEKKISHQHIGCNIYPGIPGKL